MLQVRRLVRRPCLVFPSPHLHPHILTSLLRPPHLNTDPALLAAYRHALTHRLSYAPASDLAAALHALARADRTAASTSNHAAFSTALDAALWRLAGQGQPLPPTTTVALLHALAALGHRPQEPWLLRRLVEGAAARVGDTPTRGVVQVLEALARLGFHPGVDLLGVFVAAAQQRMAAATPAAAATAGLAVAAVLEEVEEEDSEEAGVVGAFGPPDTKGLATLVRALLRLSHYPGRDFLASLESALGGVVARGARLAWAPMALAAFGHRNAEAGSGGGGNGNGNGFHRGLSRGLMMRDRQQEEAAGAVNFNPRRIATLTLSQLAAILWGLAAVDGGEEDVVGRRLARRVMAEACLRLQGQGPKPRVAAAAPEDEDEEEVVAVVGALECDLDALTVHARLRQAGLYFAEAHARVTTEEEQRQLQLPMRFLALVDGYARQCLGAVEGGENEEEEAEAVASPEGAAFRAEICARLGGAGWRCLVPPKREGGGAAGKMGWLGTPDLVVMAPASSGDRPVAIVLLLPGQFFASHGIGEEECDDGGEECMVAGGDGQASVRPLGAAAFRLRCLKARWSPRRVLVVTPESLDGLEGRLVAAFE